MMLSKPTSFIILSFFFLSATFAQWGPPPPGQGHGGGPQGGGSKGGQIPSLPFSGNQTDSNLMFECLSSMGKISTGLNTIRDAFDDANYSTSIFTNLTSMNSDLQFFLTDCANSFFSTLPQGGNASNLTIKTCEDFVSRVNATIIDIKNSWMTNSQQALNDIQTLISIIPQGPPLCIKPPSGNRLLSESTNENFIDYLCMEKYLEAIPEVSKTFKSLETNQSFVPKMTNLLTNVLPILRQCHSKSYDYVHRMLLIMNISSCVNQIFVMVPMVESYIDILKNGNETVQEALVGLQDDIIENGDKFFDECNIEGIFDRVPPVEDMIQQQGCLEELDSISEALDAFGNDHHDPLYKLKLISEVVMHSDLAYAYCVAE